MKASELGLLVKHSIEFIGKHPLVTGILATLSILGFMFSIYVYQEDKEGSTKSSQQMEKNISAISDVGKEVRVVAEATLAACAKSPCWSLSEFVRSETLGKAKDLIDSKIAPATKKENGQFLYEIDGCLVRVEFTDEAVTYLSANLYKYVVVKGQKNQYGDDLRERRPCNFSVADLFGFTGNPKLSDNLNFTVADAVRIVEPDAGCVGCNPPTLRISSACLDCGNYSEPYIEFMQPGVHAGGFVNSFFTTAFDPLNDLGDEGFRIYSTFREVMRGYIGEEAQYGIEIKPLCNRNIYPDVRKLLSKSQISAVGVGVGPRTWTNALFCKWWE